MTPLLINTGSVPNDLSADSLFSAFNKVNANFTELYLVVGLGPDSLQETVQDYAASLFTTGIHHGISVSYRDSHDRIDLTALDQSWNQLLDKPFIPTDVNQLTDNSGLLGHGGSGTIEAGDTPPANPTANALWYDTTGGRLYVYFSNTWVDSNPETQYPPPTRVTQSDTVPTNPVDGELWYDTESGRIYVYYTSTWVDTNPDSTPQTLRFCLGAIRTLITDETNPQSLFGVGVKVNSNTRYDYKITGVVSKASSNPIELQYSLAGTAGLSKHHYDAICSESNTNPLYSSNQLTSNFDTVVSISTGVITQPTNYNFTITGIIDVSNTGTVNPMIAFTGLPGDCSVLSGRIELTPLGSTGANTVIGTWSV
jgi:hypothetical protein